MASTKHDALTDDEQATRDARARMEQVEKETAERAALLPDVDDLTGTPEEQKANRKVQVVAEEIARDHYDAATNTMQPIPKGYAPHAAAGHHDLMLTDDKGVPLLTGQSVTADTVKVTIGDLHARAVEAGYAMFGVRADEPDAL